MKKPEVGKSVSPIGPTRDGLTEGIVRDLWVGDESGGREDIGVEFALVYWPEIDSEGRWPVSQLRRVG